MIFNSNCWTVLLLAAVKKASGQDDDAVLDLAEAEEREEGDPIGTLKGLPTHAAGKHDIYANTLLSMGATYVLVKVETEKSEETGEEVLVAVGETVILLTSSLYHY